MSQTIRALLFNAIGVRETSFRSDFEQLGYVDIVDELCDWESLREALRDPSIDMLAVSMDDAKDIGLDVVQRVAQLKPNCGIIGISSKTDPNAIIQAMRAGCSQFVCMPIDKDDLHNAVERIRHRAKHDTTVHHCKRICVVGSSGGAGSTTVACNLAMEFAHISNHRCALVDLNLEFGDVSCAFDCSPPFSVADVCGSGMQVDAIMLTKALHELPCNVAILSRPERVEAAREVTPEGIQSMFDTMSLMFPYVVVDVPRAYNFFNAMALGPADHILLVTQLTVPSLRNATRVHKCLLEMGADEDRIDIVLNRVKSTFERITPDDVEAHFGRPILAMIPNDYRRVQSALDFGHPIVADAPNTPSRLAIQKLARTLAGEADTGAATGFFNKLLGRRNKEKVGQLAL